MQRITFKKVFNLKNKVNKEGEAPIYIRVTIERRAYYFNTYQYLKPKLWNPKKLEVALEHPRSFEINTAIDNMINKMKNHVLLCNHEARPVSFEELRQLFEVKVPKFTSFTKFFHSEMESRNDLEGATLVNHRRTYEVLCEFNTEIAFNDLSYELIQNFEYYLISKDLAPNTRGKYHKNIKSYINAAISKGLFARDKHPYYKFQSPKSGTNRDSLTLQEIERLENLVLEEYDKHLEPVRDMFVFSCFAGGLRISDIISLEKKHIHMEDGKMNLSKRMVKGMKRGKYVNLPLHDLYGGKPKKILEKYLQSTISERIFPQLSEQYINRALKELGKLAKIKAKLTFHIARHSFGTNSVEVLGDPILVKELMGHSKLDTTMVYVHKNPGRISKQLQNIDWNKSKK